ncbi:MAG: metallophosphoesterase [Deltaproteobacteria bacterium]|nr:metallophosphoesterase [Deltaproteobacteria bacterium]
MNFALVLFVYVFLSVILPLPAGFKAKGAMVIVFLLSAGRLAILRHFFPGLGGIETSKTLLVASAFFQGIVIILFLLAIARDLVWVGSFSGNLFHKAESARHFRVFLKGIPFTLGLLAVSSLLSAYSLYEAVKVPGVREVTMEIAGWPRPLDGFRVAVISDTHLSRFHDGPWMDEVADRVNALKPELVLVPGDLVDGDTFRRAREAKALGRLKSTLGTYVCAGNHEYISGLREWMPEFSKLGLKLLHNEHAILNVGGSEFAIAGVADPAAERRGLPGPDLGKALEGIPPNGPPVILLDHRPARAPGNSLDGRVSLQLSGHTHGGLFPILATLVKKTNGGFLKGRYRIGDLELYVHPGTGLWSGVPMRILNPSEITLLTLRSAPRSARFPAEGPGTAAPGASATAASATASGGTGEPGAAGETGTGAGENDVSR